MSMINLIIITLTYSKFPRKGHFLQQVTITSYIVDVFKKKEDVGWRFYSSKVETS